jgi:ribosomal protein L11 methyltransferase
MPWQSLSLIIDAATADELGDSLQQLGALSISLADPSAGTDQEQALFGEPGSEPDALWNQVQLVALFEQGADAALTLRKACPQLGRTGLGALDASAIRPDKNFLALMDSADLARSRG